VKATAGARPGRGSDGASRGSGGGAGSQEEGSCGGERRGEGEDNYSSGNCGASAAGGHEPELAMSDLESRLEIIRPEDLRAVKLLGTGGAPES
jgi:hypothetical protein